MSWAFFAIFPPLLWSFGNIVDQILARDLFHRSAFSFLIISSILTLPFAVFVAIWQPHVFDLPLRTIWFLLVGGFFGFVGAWPYLLALQKEDAAGTIPILQIVPVFAYIMGLVVLGETLTPLKLCGGTLVVVGALVFAWNPDTRRLHFRSLFLMSLAAFTWAAYGMWIRFWALEVHWAAIMFWAYVSWVVLGGIGFCLMRNIRNDAWLIMRAGSFWPVLFPLLMLQQALLTAADMAQAKAMSISPTGVHVILFNGLQPAVIMLLCGFMYRFRPDLFEAIKRGPRLYLRLICMVGMFGGLVLLLR